MRVPRALIVALALMVSPVAASACEMACGLPAHGASHSAQTSAPAVTSVDEHAQHAHHAAPAAEETVAAPVPAVNAATVSLPAPDCDLQGADPALVRTTSGDRSASAAVLTTSVIRLDRHADRSLYVAAAAFRPPAPPPHSLVPLRI